SGPVGPLRLPTRSAIPPRGRDGRPRLARLEDAPADDEGAEPRAAGHAAVGYQGVEQRATEGAREVIPPLGQVRAAASPHRRRDREPATGELNVSEGRQHVVAARPGHPPAGGQIPREGDAALAREVAVAAPRAAEVGGRHGSGGRFWAHGRAASKAADARSTVASSNRRPTTCSPIGSPPLVKPHGTDAAGCPVRLNG